MTGALDGRHVLVPRGGAWGEKVARLLAGHGATATVVPLIAFAPPDDVAPLDAALGRLAEGAYAWLVVTSATTVDAVVGRLPGPAPRHGVERSDADPAPGGAESRENAPCGEVGGGATRVAAVGPGTASALARVGVTADLVPSGERSARGLLADFPPAPDDAAARRRVLLPHSDLAEPTMRDGLAALGWEVDDVVAYRTVPGTFDAAPVAERLAAGGFDAVLLSSASTVRNLVALLGPPPPSTRVAVIGPRTREAAVAAGLTVHVEADDASAEALVDALAAAPSPATAPERGGSAAGTAADLPHMPDPVAPSSAATPGTTPEEHP